MLKRGKNRPAPAVLRAEYLSLARSTKQQAPSRPARRCPFPQCKATPEPHFCPAHWALIDNQVRRELLAEVRRMTSKGQGPTVRLAELVLEAIRGIKASFNSPAVKAS